MNDEKQFRPVGKRVMVMRKKLDAGGLELTEELEREVPPDTGEIISIGHIGLWAKHVRGIMPGRRIHFTRYSPVKILDENKEWIYVNLDDILAVES